MTLAKSSLDQIKQVNQDVVGALITPWLKQFTELIKGIKMPVRASGVSSQSGAKSAISAAAFTIAEAFGRVGFVIHNRSGQDLYVKFGTAASSSDYTYKIATDGHLESPADPIYTGIITGRLGTGTGSIQFTELTA